MQVKTNFPGGNAVVDKVSRETIHLRPDFRDTAGEWFYWCCEITNIETNRVRIILPRDKFVGPVGPAVSWDRGKTWSWLGKKARFKKKIGIKIPPGRDHVRVASIIPYVESNFQEWLKQHEGKGSIEVTTLCITKNGRKVESVLLPARDRPPRQKILLTCRHHACEAMASFVLEGILSSFMDEKGQDTWINDHVDVLAIPSVDKDGVEEGDQGKNRQPRDHNRDYKGESIHAETRAIRETMPRWAEDKLVLSLDMHCPGIGENRLYFFGMDAPGEPGMVELQALSREMELAIEEMKCPLLFKMEDNVPFGQGWNQPKNYAEGRSMSRWAWEVPRARLSTTLEVPYSLVLSELITPEKARHLGSCIGRAISHYLQKVNNP